MERQSIINKSFALFVFSLFLCTTIPNTAGISYSDIVIDGNLSDWDLADNLGLRKGANLGFSWDEENLYFYWNGTDLGGTEEGADLFFYFSTNTLGSNLTKCCNFVEHNLPFKANY